MKRILFLTMAAAVTMACGPSESSCAGRCYDPTTTSCLQDYNGNYALCPTGTQVCNGACYDPSKYNCQNGALSQGAATKTPSSSAKASTTKAPTSTTAAAVKATTSSTSKSTTSSTVAAAKSTTSANVATTAAAAPATSSSSGSAAQVPSPCYSGCPSGLCNCNGACYTAGQYNCPTDGYNGKLVLCSGNYGSCNNVCYDTTKYSCSNGNVVAGGAPIVTRSSTSSSSSTMKSTTGNPATTAVVVNPQPVASNNFPSQTADLRIINNCKTQLWFEARYGGAGAPLPGQSATSIQALPGSYVDYVIPDTGLSGTRFWAKYGCDNYGKNCLIGDQMQYYPNPPGGCPPGGCTPPVDSLFEATWGCRPGSSCNSQNPTTWFDTSQVDGWTIPYKLTPVGDTSGCDCVGSNCGFKGVDASTLDVTKCPSGEDLTYNGQYNSVTTNGQTVSLKSVDLRIINNGTILGCMSPCKRLNWGAPYGLQQDESSGSPMWMCCPTPTPSNCSPSNGCVTPDNCRAGPIEQTQFVNAVHAMAPGVYAYSYDDGVGLHACPAGVTKYTMEFCPSGSAPYPGRA